MSDETEAHVWYVSEVSIVVNGTEIDEYVSFVYEGDEDVASHIKASKGVTGYQYKGGEPKATLKVKSTCSKMSTLYDIRDNKIQVPITFQTPVKTVNCISAIIASIKEDEVAEDTPGYTISILAMKIESKPKTTG